MHPPPVLAALAALATGPSTQGFVERALELGLVHDTLTGMDLFASEVTDEAALDWLQNGLAVGDADGDGDLDLIAVGGLVENALFLQGPEGFTEATAGSGIDSREYDRVPAFGDYDRNGTLDLFIGAAEGGGTGPRPGRSRLYRNDGTATFEDVTALAGTTGRGRSLYAQWTDLDLDGLLDLYVGEFFLTSNVWYRNNGDGSFTDLTVERGLDEGGSAHVAACFDSDRDGDADVFVGNDYKIGAALNYSPEVNPGDEYFENTDGLFRELSHEVGLAHKKGIMGYAWGDVDYDGWMDLYKTDVQSNILVLNNGAPASGIPWTNNVQDTYGVGNSHVPFEDGSGLGVSVGWAAFFFNADLDRWLDLYVVNGHVAAVNADIESMPQNQPNYLFRGDGPAAGFTFTDETVSFGLWERYDDRAAALCDLDRDGDLDLFVMADSGRLRYLRNDVDREGQGWILVEADTGTSVPGGGGTLVEWTDSDGHPHVRVMGADAPTASQNENMAYFGLGHEPEADLVVTFPSGIRRVFPNVPPDTRLVAQEPALFELSTRTLPAAGAGHGPDEVTVTVFAHRNDGAPLDETADVQLFVPGLTPTGPVTNAGGNRFERTFVTSAIPGEYPAIARINGWQPRISPNVQVVGPPSPLGTRPVAVPEALRAGSSDTCVVRVAPKDEHGVAIGPGRAVTIELSGMAATGPVTDHGDGRYSRAFAAAATPLAAAATITCDGADVSPSQPLVEVGGGPDGAATVVDVQSPFPLQATMPHQIKVQIRPRDATGLRLGPGCDVSVRLVNAAQDRELGPPAPVIPPGPGEAPAATPSASSATATGAGVAPTGLRTVWVKPEFGHVGQDDGDFLFVLEKTPLMDFQPAGTFEVTVDGVVLGTYPFAYQTEMVGK